MDSGLRVCSLRSVKIFLGMITFDMACSLSGFIRMGASSVCVANRFNLYVVSSGHAHGCILVPVICSFPVLSFRVQDCCDSMEGILATLVFSLSSLRVAGMCVVPELV